MSSGVGGELHGSHGQRRRRRRSNRFGWIAAIKKQLFAAICVLVLAGIVGIVAAFYQAA